MELSDQTASIRNGEELPLAEVEEYIRDEIDGLSGDMTVRQFPKGHSNLTYLVTVGDREMVLRRPPHGTKAKSAHDMGREYGILSALHGVYPYCPKPLAYTEDDTVMGCPFYLMERIKGIIIRKDLPAQLRMTAAQTTQLFENVLAVQYELHAIDYHKIGLSDFGKPEGYVERQILGWNKRYRKSRTPDAPDGEAVMDWLASNMPVEMGQPGIVHNDYKFDNVILDPENPFKVIGVLDWEMATIGDPLMDLGCTLGYWIEPGDPQEMQVMRMMPTDAEGALTREQVVRRYAALSGRTMDDFSFYHCFGMFRLAVIAQQIYYRFFHGQTKDDRFKSFIFGVHVLINAAMRIVVSGGKK